MDVGQESESSLDQRVLELCDTAYAGGVPATEIFAVLNSTPCSKHQQTSLNRRSLLGLICAITVIALSLSISPLKWKEARCILPSHPLIMEILRPVANCAFCRDQSPIIEFSSENHPSKDQFLRVAYSSKPIIVHATENSTPSITFETLRDIFESEDDGVSAVEDECQFLPLSSPFSSLADAFARIPQMLDEPWYIGWSNCHPGVSTRLRNLVPRPPFIPEGSSSSVLDWIFIGSPGLGAAMHIDYVQRPSWQIQLNGVKRWELKPPPECEAQCPQVITFTIRPGDILFLETNLWYHETIIQQGTGLSISIGSEYD